MPKVSVMLSSFNHAKYICEAIESTLNQTFTDFELIILDDGSSDNSWDLINQYSDPRIKAYRNAVNIGGVETGNKAIAELDTGKYIAIHHSDDIWELDKLAKQVAILDANLGIGAVFTHALIINEDGVQLADEKHFYSKIFDQPNRTRHEWLRFFFTNGNALCHPSMLIRKTCYEDCGYYSYGMAQLPDFDMWVRLCLKYEIHVLPERLVRFRVRDNEANASGNRPETRIRMRFEFYNILQNYRKLTRFDDLIKVFPTAEKFNRNEETDMDFVLGMVVLEQKPFIFTQLFGLELLFEAISDPKRAENIKRLYDFDYKNFIALTGQHDVFSQEEIAERDMQIASLNQAVAERDGQIASLNHAASERDGQIAALHQAVGERDGQIASLHHAVAERDGQIASLHHAVAERDGQIAYLLAERDSFLNSKSWRLTRPARSIGKQWKRLRRIMKLIKSAIRHEGGIVPTAGKAARTYRSEGLDGVRRALSAFPAHTPARPVVSSQLSGQTAGSNPVISRIDFAQTRDQFVEYQKNPPIDPLVKLIAFYLPQFHPFPENDEWWGKGFTEWTNVGKALPNYVGHYQPHCPIHNGYYDLRVPGVMEEQARLAKEYGIYGFCYYFYWFDGKILMDTPLEMKLANHKVDIPFCLAWANENWSRRWDGKENDVLIAQNHSDEDSLAFILHLVKYFKDERYIRIDGKPVLIIYRANIIPNMAATAKIWRKELLKHGIPGLYLISAQTFGIRSPKEFDFDASVEFPPHTAVREEIQNELDMINPNFTGRIYSYEQVVSNAVSSKEPDYKLYRTAMLSWDNTARKQNNSHIFHGFSLSLYKNWLSSIINKNITNPKYTADEKIVFVNAWNEWAEGTHLEPDQKLGYGYLQTTYDALKESIRQPVDQSHKIIVVSHDAHPHGAQYLALNMAREFFQGFGFSVDLICLGEGMLKSRYAEYARLHDLTGLEHRGAAAHMLAKKLAAAGHRFAIVNTTVSGFFIEALKAHGIKCISLIHELRGVIDQNKLHSQAQTIARLADKVIFPARQVADEFQEIAPVSDARYVLRPQGLYKKNSRIRKRDVARQELRKALNLAPDALIILNVGYADHRKGIDLFVEIGRILVGHQPNAYLIWLGHWDGKMQARVESSLAKDSQLSSHFIFPGRRDDTDLFYAGADVFALTSREDPFPSVVLEAMEASLPVVGFEGIGGCTELLADGGGKLVSAFDVTAFSSALQEILEDHALATRMGQIGQSQIREHFSFRNYLFDLLKLIEYPLPRLSVVVPNYNYARFLPDRIKTIVEQKFPIYELIILDDCSSDNSVQAIEEIIKDSALDIKFICNNTNSGSVFAQWHKGVELARGDLVWIAEADDLSEPDFLADVVRSFDNPEVVLSYSESKQIDLGGKVLCDNYLDYVADIGRERWLKPYIHAGRNEIVEALSVKNTIPNVSAVVFRRDILNKVLKLEQEQLREFKVAGDYYVYTKVLEHGGIAFTTRSSNLHRRHEKSVTHASFNLSLLAEIVRMQRMVADCYQVSGVMQETARRYAQKLYEQFGLASSEFPNFEQIIMSADCLKKG